MAKKNAPNMRVDSDFAEDMKKIAKIRLNSGLAKFDIKELCPREMTRLLRKTNGYKMSITELKTKPKRENII